MTLCLPSCHCRPVAQRNCFAVPLPLAPPALLIAAWVALRVSYSAVGPFAQARDTAQQKEEKEHADHNLKIETIKRRKKGSHSSTKMDFFMRLRTDSYLAQMSVYLSWSSKEIHMISDMFGLSNTKHLRRNAVLHGE
jgi:hypothetical protein